MFLRLTITGVLLIAAPAFGQQLMLRERSSDVTEATMVVDAPPGTVYQLATDYRRWPLLFSDIRSVAVIGGDREHARVRFRSRAIDREVTVQFDNIPDRLIRFAAVRGSRAGRARGEYILTPVDGGRRTLVTARLFIKVVGPAKLFVSASDARTMRQRKLRADLTDTQRWLAHAARASSALSVKGS